MLIAVNATKLFLLISLGLMFFLGQGWLVVGSLLHGSLTTKKRDIPLLHEIPLMLLSGLIINYGIILIFQSLKFSLVFGWIISIFGLCCFALYNYRNHRLQKPISVSSKIWIGISFVCLLFLSPILAEPLTQWDARSIWFFHAKMIYAANSIGQLAGWQHPSIIFSHSDYPNLVPVMAAQVATVVGFWNEYIPKFSLFLMLVPAIAWLFTFARRSFSFVILIFLFPYCFYEWIWNGYMDGYLALYFSIAMLLWGRYIKTSHTIDMISSLCCLIVLFYIKNEGALAALAGLLSITLIHLIRRKPYSIKEVFTINWKYIITGVIALLPFMLWSFYKQQWNISNDLGIGTIKSLLHIISRLSDGSFILILTNVYLQIEGALLLLGLVFLASIAWKKPIGNESLLALLAAGIFCFGMIIIYLMTPLDLGWHLRTTISRTMLSVNGCIFIGSFYILSTIENSGNVQ